MSLIIPSYNQAEFLPAAIESALNQTLTIEDIIVVDDGSTDNSAEIAARYPVRLIRQVNKGLASARNTGIMNAIGDYVGFLDADDVLLENYNQRIKEVIETTNADIISPSFKCFGKENHEIILMPNPTFEDFKTGNRVGYCSAIKLDVIKSVGGYSPRMTWGYEDYHLWFDLLKRGYKIVTIPEVLWLYRTKEQSMITQAQQHHDELMAQINKDHKIYE